MPEFITPSGKKAVINIAPFEDAMNLKAAIGKVMAESNFDFKIEPERGLEQDIDVAAFAKIAALVDSDAEIREKVMICLGRCTYNSEKITNQTFEPAEAREDYYPIVLACLKENLYPFFKSLISKFSPKIQAAINSAMNEKEEIQS